VKTAQQGTSVNDICCEAIERFASDGEGESFMRDLRALARPRTVTVGLGGTTARSPRIQPRRAERP
jgi:hypothetical protein